MTRKDGRRWGAAEDEAFLAALAEHCQVRAAARAIGWGPATAHRRRRRCADFAARWEALRLSTLRQGSGQASLDLSTSLERGGSLDFARDERSRSGPPPGHVRPARVGRGGVPVRPQFIRGPGRWTEAVERDFLDMLATTSNVRASCEAAGIGANAVYRRRREHPEFERAWDAALAQGYARLEMGVVCAAAESVEGRSFTERDIGPISADQAIKLIGLHRAAVKGEGKRPGGRPRPPSVEQVLETIRRRAAAIRAARKEKPKDPPFGPA